MREPIQNMAPTPSELAVEPFIDKRTVARLMGQTTRAVELQMRRGLPYYKIGSRTAFRWSEIQAFLARTSRVCRQGGLAQ